MDKKEPKICPVYEHEVGLFFQCLATVLLFTNAVIIFLAIYFL